ncbi:TPA: NusG domain II-containing protein [Clostridioides difficile]|nr:NusG domain II-containing protein [Clostridioides difficile]HDJ1468773.1 NusG domain II-containing protein [Clostridioides difficile]
MKKKDILLILGILVVITACYGIINVINSKNAGNIEIYVDNKLYKTVSIDAKEEFKIENRGGYNIVKIHDKGVEIVDASCPDKVCVHTGFINKPSQSIVCIPNRVSIKINTNEKNDNQEDIISK